MDDEKASSLQPERKKVAERNINADGMAYSMMAGIGDAYLPAALVLLGASSFYIGLLAALPQFVGAAFQFVSLSAIRLIRSRKLLVLIASSLQTLTWLGIVLLILWPSPVSDDLILALFSLGVGFSLFANPAWSSWIADIIPGNERASFFAHRNKLMQIVLFITIFVAGMAVRQLQLDYGLSLAFAAIFLAAFAARASTVWFHSRVDDIKYEIRLINEIKLKHLFLLPAYKNELWFLGFVALMGFSVQFASPFFTPYMLNNLRFDVGMLGTLTAIAIVAKIVSFPYWGKAIDKFSNRTVLIATAAFAPAIPLMWLFASDFWSLVLFQVVSGFIWSGYELAVFNSALSIVGRDLRASFISKYNIFTAFSNGAGALAGGAFLMAFPNASLLGFEGILLVFLLSFAMRLATFLLFAPHLSRGREIENKTADRAMIFRIVAVYPTQGAVMHVMNGWDFTRKAVEKSTLESGIMLRKGVEATGDIVREGGRKIYSSISRKGRL